MLTSRPHNGCLRNALEPLYCLSIPLAGDAVLYELHARIVSDSVEKLFVRFGPISMVEVTND
jgi:hypothetical protein